MITQLHAGHMRVDCALVGSVSSHISFYHALLCR
jgi:hypothetical protein